MERYTPERRVAVESALRVMADSIIQDRMMAADLESGIPTLDPKQGTTLDSVNDPTFPKVVDRTKPDPSQRNIEEMDMAGGEIKHNPLER